MPGKSQILQNNKETKKVMIDKVLLTSGAEEKLFGISLNFQLKF